MQYINRFLELRDIHDPENAARFTDTDFPDTATSSNGFQSSGSRPAWTFPIESRHPAGPPPETPANRRMKNRSSGFPSLPVLYQI
jgi:hypothetical protein